MCRERERERVCVCRGEGERRREVVSIAAVVLDLVLLGAALPVAVARQEELPGTNLSVVLCELDEGFKGLWVPYQGRSIR